MALIKYTQEELFGKFLAAIERGQPHKHYQRTVQLAKFYRQVMTGEGQDDLIVSYKERETEDQKKQRINITLSRTKHIANKVYNQYDELRRVDNVVDNITYTDKGRADAKVKLAEALGEFYADKHLSQYLYERLRFLTFYDPNSYIVVEYREHVKEDGTITNRSYPLEIFSEQVYDAEYYLGNLQYVISKVVRHPKMKPGAKAKTKDLCRYVLYGKDTAIEALEIDEGEDISMFVDYERFDIRVDDREDKVFLIRQMETMTGMVPAICVGYIPDAQTYGATYVSPIDPAENLFRKLINRNSELELHRALHGFYQKFALADECDYRDMRTGEACLNGSLGDRDCPKCGGTGRIVHRSVQDVMYVMKPQSRDEHIPLSEYVHYVQIPQYITDSIQKEVDDLERQIGEAIFSNEVFDKTEVAATATEARLNMRGLYNALSSYAANWSEVYKHCVWQTAHYLDIADGLIVDHRFPSDFKMETVDQLIMQRQTAITAGAPYHIVKRIDMAILQKQNQDDPDFVQMVQVREEHKPFKGKTEQERLLIINLLPITDPDRILWTYYDEIMRQAETENAAGDTPFYKLPYERRKNIIDAIVLQRTERAREQEQQAREAQMSSLMNQYPAE